MSPRNTHTDYRHLFCLFFVVVNFFECVAFRFKNKTFFFILVCFSLLATETPIQCQKRFDCERFRNRVSEKHLKGTSASHACVPCTQSGFRACVHRTYTHTHTHAHACALTRACARSEGSASSVKMSLALHGRPRLYGPFYGRTLLGYGRYCA